MEGWNRTAQLRARVKLGAPPREEGLACPGRLGKHCSSLPFVKERTLSQIWGWGTQTHPAPQVKRECACSGPHTWGAKDRTRAEHLWDPSSDTLARLGSWGQGPS